MTDTHQENAPTKRRRLPGWAKLLVLVVLAAGGFFFFRSFDVQGALKSSLDWIEARGALGRVIFIILYILATVFFVPGTILTLGAGVLFGVAFGSVYVSIGSTVGAALAFLLGRYFMRERVSEWIEDRGNFKAIDEAMAEEGWKIVGLMRLSPIFPFVLINYAFGLTRVSFLQYLAASWIGMMPGTVLYVYLGAAAGSLATLGAEGEGTIIEQVFFFAGLAATLLVTVYVTQVARKALKRRIESAEREEDSSSGSAGSGSLSD